VTYSDQKKLRVRRASTGLKASTPASPHDFCLPSINFANSSEGALSFSPDPGSITLIKHFSQSISLKCATRYVCVVVPRVSSSFPLSRGLWEVHPLRYMSSGDVAARGRRSFTLLARGREQGPSQPCEIGSSPVAFLNSWPLACETQTELSRTFNARHTRCG
jgi:hypothetical protein